MKKALFVSALAIASCTTSPNLDKLKPASEYYYSNSLKGPSPENICDSKNSSTILLTPYMLFPLKILKGRIKIAEIKLDLVKEEIQHIKLYLENRSFETNITKGNYVLIGGINIGKKTSDIAALIACGAKGTILLLNTDMNDLGVNFADDPALDNQDRIQTYMGKFEYGTSTNFFASDPQKICKGEIREGEIFFYNGVPLVGKIELGYKRRKIALFTLHPQERFIKPKQRITIEFYDSRHRMMDILISYGDYTLIRVNEAYIAALISCDLGRIAIVPNSELKKGSLSANISAEKVPKRFKKTRQLAKKE